MKRVPVKNSVYSMQNVNYKGLFQRNYRLASAY